MGVDETVGRWVDGHLCKRTMTSEVERCAREMSWGKEGMGRDCMRKYMCSYFFSNSFKLFKLI